MRYKFTFLLLMIWSIVGCSSLSKSLLLGTAIGGVTGTTIGHNFGKGDDSKRMTGTLIGAALGGLISYMVHHNKPSEKSVIKSIAEEVPLLTRPKVRKIWIKDEVKGKRFVRGHWEYVLEENSEWTR